MAAQMISLPSDVDVSKITFASPKNLDTGGKMIPVYHDGKPFIVQTPAMVSPYGMSKWPGDRGVDKYNLDLTLNPNDPQVAQFFELLKSIDEKLIEEGVANSLNWFKKKQGKEIIEALYSPLVRYSKDKETGEISNKYHPIFRLNVPYRDGKFACEAYNNKREQIDLAATIDKFKQANVQAIVQCSGIWIAGGKFGCNFKILQMKINSTKSSIKEYAFIDDEDDVEN